MACIAAAWASALLATNFAGHALAWPCAVLLWGIGGGCLAIAYFRPSRRAVLPPIALCVTIAALVATVALTQAATRQPQLLLDAASSARAVTVTGSVVSAPRAQATSFAFEQNPRVYFGLRIESIRGGENLSAEGLSVPAQAFAQLHPGAPALEIGTTVAVAAKIVASAPGEPNAFRVYARDALEVVEAAPWYLAWAAQLRSEFRASAGLLPGDGGALLPGLAIGDTTAVSESLDEAMKESSLSHLTAVSGANCAIVVAGIMLLGAAIKLSRWARIGLALMVLIGFIILVTPEPSVLRAGTMVLIVLIALGSGRPGGGVPALTLAAVALLTLDPWLAASYGFALSVLATGGLLLLTAPLGSALERWMPRPLALALAIPLAAQLACQPVLVMLNPSVSVLGVPANLLAGPAAPMATVLGLIACLLLPVLPSLGFAIAQIAWLPAAWIAAVARTIADLPGAQAPWLGGALGAVLLAVATAAGLWLLLRTQRAVQASELSRSFQQRFQAGSVMTVSIALVIAGGVYGGAVFGAGVVRGLSRPHDWMIAQCDVGQGDAVVIRDGSYIALVDTGPQPDPLRKCLTSLGIDYIDLLVITHFDLDHVGGLSAIEGLVGTALVGPPAEPRDEVALQPLRAAGATVHIAQRGDHGSLGALNWRVLWPTGREGPLNVGNPGSVVLETEVGGIRSIYLGDLGEESERALQRVEKLRSYDIVKVAHHGSSDQDPELYASIQARVGLIGVGAENGYGHPTPSLLRILSDHGTRAFRSDLHGLVLVTTADERGEFRVWTERSEG